MAGCQFLTGVTKRVNQKGPIDTYVQDLSRKLATFPTRRRRILKEAREHLQDSAAVEIERGASTKEAESVAVGLFGSTDDFIARLKAKGGLSPTPTPSGSRNPSSRSSFTDASQMKRTSTKTSHIGRRYPALAFIAVGAALALLLPTALNVPQSGPTNLAEYAPVPGKGEGESQLSDPSQANSGGLGFGSGTGEGSGSGSSGLGAPGQRRPKLKRCVGNPPRQTEDPLSPPCVAYFEGDNFGATAKGVTENEIRVVIVRGCNNGSLEITDLDAAETDWSRAYAGLLAYFGDRFQTYGRRLHGYTATFGACLDNARARADALKIVNQVGPFVVIAFTAPRASAVDAFAERGVMVTFPGIDRALMVARAPFVYSVPPDLEDHTDIIASFVCNKLAGQPAQYAGDPTLKSRIRRFALVYKRDQGDDQSRGAALLTQRIGDGCGDKASEVMRQSGDSPETYAQDAVRWKVAGITTVLIVGGQPLAAYQGADSAGWYPEWMQVPTNFGNAWARLIPATQQRNAFGLMFTRRLDRTLQHQEWYRAFREGCPDCPFQQVSALYEELLLVSWGIQAAGPKLTAANVDKGLHAIPARRSPNPWTPAAYLAPGNYSFFKDAAVARWAPAERANETTPPGCFVLVEDGRRYRAQDFASHPSDNDFEGSWPCQGDPT